MKTESRQNTGLHSKSYVLTIQLKPETWIIAPLTTKNQLKRYAKLGWISNELAEHLDRAFPRNADGKPIIFKAWLLSPMKKACDKLGYDRKILDFEIIDEHGNPIDYIVIPEQPLVYKRAILTEKPSLEMFEYIDGTYTLEFKIKTNYPKEILEILTLAGKIGLMGRVKYGYGRFRVTAKYSETQT